MDEIRDPIVAMRKLAETLDLVMLFMQRRGDPVSEIANARLELVPVMAFLRHAETDGLDEDPQPDPGEAQPVDEQVEGAPSVGGKGDPDAPPMPPPNKETEELSEEAA